MRVLVKYFQTNIYQAGDERAKVFRVNKTFSQHLEKRENWTNDTQMCCWKFISNSCVHVYFESNFMCCLSHLENMHCRKFLRIDPFSNFITCKLDVSGRVGNHKAIKNWINNRFCPTELFKWEMCVRKFSWNFDKIFSSQKRSSGQKLNLKEFLTYDYTADKRNTLDGRHCSSPASPSRMQELLYCMPHRSLCCRRASNNLVCTALNFPSCREWSRLHLIDNHSNHTLDNPHATANLEHVAEIYPWCAYHILHIFD